MRCSGYEVEKKRLLRTVVMQNTYCSSSVVRPLKSLLALLVNGFTLTNSEYPEKERMLAPILALSRFTQLGIAIDSRIV